MARMAPDAGAAAYAVIALTIYGQAASKANSRQIVTIGERPAVIKSPEARRFMRDARRQIPPACRVRLQGPVVVTLHMHYASYRPDLDESVVLDALQDVYAPHPSGHGLRVLVQAGVYCNDRQVWEKHVYRHLDRTTPRVEVRVEPLQQGELFGLQDDEPAPA